MLWKPQNRGRRQECLGLCRTLPRRRLQRRMWCQRPRKRRLTASRRKRQVSNCTCPYGSCIAWTRPEPTTNGSDLGCSGGIRAATIRHDIRTRIVIRTIRTSARGYTIAVFEQRPRREQLLSQTCRLTTDKASAKMTTVADFDRLDGIPLASVWFRNRVGSRR